MIYFCRHPTDISIKPERRSHVIYTIFRLLDFFKYTKEARISAYAAYAVYFTVLSVFPMLMLLLSIIHFLPIENDVLLSSIFAFVPSTFQPLVQSIIQDLDQKTTTTLVSVTAISTLWSSSKGIYGLYQGLNSVYQTTKTRGFFVKKGLCLLYTFFFVLVIILILMLLVFGNQLQLLMLHLIPVLQRFSGIISFLRSLLSVFLLICFFMVIYQVFPSKKLRLMAQLPGALFTTVCWMGLSFGFSIYIDNFGNYSYMYGSLTTIILLMLWLYLCMNIVLMGGAINVWLEEQRSRPSA